jgi:hypothetical protein
MAPSFLPVYSKTYHMPNKGNKSNGRSQSGVGQPKHQPAKGNSEKPSPERSDVKHHTNEKGHGSDNTGRTSNQGRKSASGGSAED